MTLDEKVMVVYIGFMLLGAVAGWPFWIGIVATVSALSAAWHIRGSW